MLNEPVSRQDRLLRYQRVLDKLDKLESVVKLPWPNDQPVEQEKQEESFRQSMKIIEAELSTLRLRQSESRLRQQLLVGLIGSGIGSVLTLLVQAILKSL